MVYTGPEIQDFPGGGAPAGTIETYILGCAKQLKTKIEKLFSIIFIEIIINVACSKQNSENGA